MTDLAKLAEVERRHEKAEHDIRNNFGAAYSSRIEQDSYSIHSDRATLLRILRTRPEVKMPTLSVEEIGKVLYAFDPPITEEEGDAPYTFDELEAEMPAVYAGYLCKAQAIHAALTERTVKGGGE